MFSNLRFLQDRQDAILTLVTFDNLCPHGAAEAAASSTTYNATPKDEGKYVQGEARRNTDWARFGQMQTAECQISPTERISSHE